MFKSFSEHLEEDAGSAAYEDGVQSMEVLVLEVLGDVSDVADKAMAVAFEICKDSILCCITTGGACCLLFCWCHCLLCSQFWFGWRRWLLILLLCW